jgi:hypothetical protein
MITRDEAREGRARGRAKVEREMQHREGAPALVQEVHVGQAPWAEDGHDHTEEARHIARDKVGGVLVAVRHHRGPDLAGEAAEEGPEDDAAAAEFVREREPDEAARGEAGGGGGVLVCVS